MERTDRLQRVMAARGAGSRRSAEDLIRAGRVTVNGEVVTDLGLKVDPLAAEIRVDGRRLAPQRPRTILLNKPSGYITTTSDERGRRTVMDLVRVPERVYPVGRLDRDTQGLLILTNDGDLANRVMHPRYELDKEYHVLTATRPSDRTLQHLRDGVKVEGRTIVPEEVRLLRETRDGITVKLVIHQGMYHVVRLMMETVGVPVARLRRVRIGPLSVNGIPVGGWRDATPGELHQLYQALHLDQSEEAVQAVAAARGRRAVRRPDSRPVERRPVAPRARRPPTEADANRAPARPTAPSRDVDPRVIARRDRSSRPTQAAAQDDHPSEEGSRGRSAKRGPTDRRPPQPNDPRGRGPAPSGPSRSTRGRGDDPGSAPPPERRFTPRRDAPTRPPDERGSRRRQPADGGRADHIDQGPARRRPGRGGAAAGRDDADRAPDRRDRDGGPPSSGGNRRRGGGRQDDRRPPPRRPPRRDAV